MDIIEVIIGDINKKTDQQHMLKMLELYMHDPMGGGQTLDEDLAMRNIEGLKNQSNYLFFLAMCNGEVAGIANCFINFSTFKAKQLINIHDFAVDPKYRRKGIGKAMMNTIVAYCQKKDLCKITLEVRNDNPNAQSLYTQIGFLECDPPMHFWEKVIE